ncbi:MAG: hypothetical protein HWE20_03415 [Gammaproteobacteria bacterium]|nr:hypothetical protein [Gammaproteobacteria bacterium]
MSMTRYENAKLLTPNGYQRTDIILNDGRYRIASPADQAPVEDGREKTFIPGIIDGYCHIGATTRYAQLAELAAQSGVQTLITAPDSFELIDTTADVALIQTHFGSLVAPLGCITIGNQNQVLADLATLAKAGAVGFSQGNAVLCDLQTLYNAMQYAASFDLLFVIHPAEPALSAKALVHDGEYAVRMGLIGEPSCSETISASALIQLAKATGCRLHLSRISCGGTVELMAQAKAAGQAVTCDVAIDNLTATEANTEGFNTDFKVWPVLRSEADRNALCEGVKAGIIDMVVSNHRKVSAAQKATTFDEAPFGREKLPSFGHQLLNLIETWALSAEDAHRLIRGAAERIYQLPTPDANATLSSVDAIKTGGR